MDSRNESSSSDGWREHIVVRPVTVRQTCEALNEKPVQIIAELMKMNYFTSVYKEVPDELLYRLGNARRVHFRIDEEGK